MLGKQVEGSHAVCDVRLVLLLAFFSRLEIPEIEGVVSSVKKGTCLEERLVLWCGKSFIKAHPSSEILSGDKRQHQSRGSLPGFSLVFMG